MPDNTQKIANIKAMLESGMSSMSVDGVTTALDRESLRKELRRLQAEDDSLRSRRPPCASIDLSGLF